MNPVKHKQRCLPKWRRGALLVENIGVLIIIALMTMTLLGGIIKLIVMAKDTTGQ
ncbi:MAG: hypothetical protein LBV12_11740 [Puniceicoccales bacterium]|jgi:hypothetical protein|nr:hypothetical protein [Puniceicoccales bacterium]